MFKHALIGTVLLALSASSQNLWQTYRASQFKDPDLLRHYTFENLQPETVSIPSFGSEKIPLESQVPLQVVPGRFPGKTAVHIDGKPLDSKPFDLTGKVFTAQIWFRPTGAGTQFGNAGATNGTLLSIGIGYWDGWRIITDWPQLSSRFELGRPAPLNAFGIGANSFVAANAWQHLAVSWDGKLMRLYVNGSLLSEAPYDTPYTQPDKNAPFRIGFNGYGVGSLAMDVDEVIVHRRSLAPSEILAQALSLPPLDAEISAVLNQLQATMLQKDKKEMERLAQSLQNLPQAPAALKLWLLIQGNATAEELLNAPELQNPAIPDYLRNVVYGNLLEKIHHNPLQALSKDMLMTLLASPAGEKLENKLMLSARLTMAAIQEGNRQEAERWKRQYLQLAEKLPDAQKGNFMLEIAHMFRTAKLYDEARSLYGAFATDSFSPQMRGIAALAAAQTFLLEKSYDHAIAAFNAIADMNVPAHHREEARECADEARRLAAGQPPRDPEAHHRRPAPLVIPALAVFVSPDGDDDDDGTAAHPLMSLDVALDKVRALRKANPGQAAALVLKGGTYPMTEPLVLTEADSGTQDAPFVIMAAPGEKPVLYGGARLRAFISETDPQILARLPQDKRINLMVCDLQGLPVQSNADERPLAELFEDGVPLPPSRWPDEGFVKTGAPDEDENHKFLPSFAFDQDEPYRWKDADDIWTYGYWKYLWTAEHLKIKRLDSAARKIELARLSGYGIAPGMPFYFFNLLEAIDRPGEWFLDRKAQKLYLYPNKPVRQAKLELSLFRHNFLEAKNVSHFIIHGLTFDLSQGTGVVMDNVRHVRFSGNVLSRLAGDGLVASHATDIQIYGNDFHCLGRGGMVLDGGDRKSLTPGNINVENSWVRDFSRLDRTYTPAVNLSGVGNRIAHNLFHDAPHHAIRLEGNDHLVEYNDVHSVVYESDDQSGIDMWYNPSYQGNVIRYNFWHHIGSGHTVAGQCGIRLDDAICNVLMYSNIFLCAADGHFGAIQIHGGKDNVADNNLFVACQAAASFSTWSDETWLKMFDRADMKQRLHKDIEINEPPYSDRYPWLADLKQNNGHNCFWRNLLIRCNTIAMRRNHKLHEFLETHAFDNGAAFLIDDGASASYDAAFAPEAWLPFMSVSAFRPIPFAEIGLYDDPSRASVPDKAQMRKITEHYKGNKR